jgi:hypothetical protein
MFYCGGGPDLDSYEICLRTSTDLEEWTNYQVLFQDGIQARDPMVLWIEEEQKWVMYYTATLDPAGGYYVVAYRTSDDLVNWSGRQIAYTDYHSGTTYGNTESPFVVRRGDWFYLFTGPRPYDQPTDALPNWEHPGYVGTDVYRSESWDHWENADYAGHIAAHAPEIIDDQEGGWKISHCGILQGGLYIQTFEWHDGISNNQLWEENDESAELNTRCKPNPFTEKIWIRYQLSEGSLVRVVIHDVTGNLIKVVHEGYQPAGEKSISWDGSDSNGHKVSAGIYFVQISTVKSSASLKLVYIN